MLEVIARELSTKIGEIGFYDRIGGLVRPTPVPIGESGTLKVLPVSADCADPYPTYFAPDNKKGPVGYFVDGGGMQTTSAGGGTRNQDVVMAWALNFLSWHSTKGHTDCTVGWTVQTHIVNKLMGIRQTPQALRDLGVVNFGISKIEIPRKSPDLFPFSFAEEAQRGLFDFPYDYFGFRIIGVLSVKCPTSPDYTWTQPADC
jgi:hypothetical protein